MARLRHPQRLEDIGFQIAPMIDVVFVIMLFFMVKVGSRQSERELRIQLPSRAESSTPPPGLQLVEEAIDIDEDGIISHNDEIIQDIGRDALPLLKDRMKRLAQQSLATQTEILVTVASMPDTRYSRVVDVLNAIRYAGIKNVTFNIADDD